MKSGPLSAAAARATRWVSVLMQCLRRCGWLHWHAPVNACWCVLVCKIGLTSSIYFTNKGAVLMCDYSFDSAGYVTRFPWDFRVYFVFAWWLHLLQTRGFVDSYLTQCKITFTWKRCSYTISTVLARKCSFTHINQEYKLIYLRPINHTEWPLPHCLHRINDRQFGLKKEGPEKWQLDKKPLDRHIPLMLSGDKL